MLQRENLCFVHGSPHSQHEYLLPDTSAFIALERVLATGADTLFCGHTHVPYVRHLENSHLTLKVAASSAESPIHSAPPLASLKRIINAGSVGESRHGRPNATYIIYNTETQQAELREVEYDYAQTCAAILEKGLPAISAWRLSQGLEYAEKADDPTHVCER
jgi:diadenosine tetraphosphatase ApaH/serine/threonine PP2A family protein phosphatase